MLARSIDKPPIAYGTGNLTADAATTAQDAVYSGFRFTRLGQTPFWSNGPNETVERSRQCLPKAVAPIPTEISGIMAAVA